MQIFNGAKWGNFEIFKIKISNLLWLDPFFQIFEALVSS